ncbi:Chemotaxis protein CheY [uncultured archaeon]|nr:Chemotaxis protein CheY [uncultured archaeon]
MTEESQILVVEDEALVAEDIRRTIHNLGYIVLSTASSGKEALKKVDELRPDLVLMDIVLQGEMDGIETAREIRSRFNIPVVYLTAYSDGEILERAKLTEPFGYIIKPFKERELKINIVIALYKHKVERQLRESKEFYENVLEEIINGVWATDRNDFVRYANKGALKIMRKDLEQIVGIRVLKDFPEHFKPYYLKAKKSMQPLYYKEIPFNIKDERQIYQSGWLIPRVKDGDFNGMICTIETTSEQVSEQKTDSV